MNDTALMLSWTSEVMWDPEADIPGAKPQMRRLQSAPGAFDLDEFYDPYVDLPRAAEGW